VPGDAAARVAAPVAAARRHRDRQHENHSPTGAFKVRGGLGLHGATQARAAAGRGAVISATTAQHGQSIRFAGRAFGVRVVIYVPARQQSGEERGDARFGAELVEHGKDFDRPHARREVAAGANSSSQLLRTDLVLGRRERGARNADRGARPRRRLRADRLGSCICGMITVRDCSPSDEIVGVQAAGARRTTKAGASIRRQHRLGEHQSRWTGDANAGRAVARRSSVAALRGSCSSTNDAIAQAIRILPTRHAQLVEGAGAAALAAALAEKDQLRGKKVGLVANRWQHRISAVPESAHTT